MTRSFVAKLKRKLEDRFGKKIVTVSSPGVGNASRVFLIELKDGEKFFVKVGTEAGSELEVARLLRIHQIHVPRPITIDSFELDSVVVSVSSQCKGVPFHSVAPAERKEFLPSIISCMRDVHRIRSEHCGFVNELGAYPTWQGFLNHKYSGQHPWYDWNRVASQLGEDADILRRSIKTNIERLSDLNISVDSYRLLHGDINHENVFVDKQSFSVSGIIDWSDAIFGDPLYDFARLRMNIWQLYPDGLDRYCYLLGMTASEKEVEQLYFDMYIVDALAWYVDNSQQLVEKHLQYLSQL